MKKIIQIYASLYEKHRPPGGLNDFRKIFKNFRKPLCLRIRYLTLSVNVLRLGYFFNTSSEVGPVIFTYLCSTKPNSTNKALLQGQGERDIGKYSRIFENLCQIVIKKFAKCSFLFSIQHFLACWLASRLAGGGTPYNFKIAEQSNGTGLNTDRTFSSNMDESTLECTIFVT